MNGGFSSYYFLNNIWHIGVDCSHSPSDLHPFTGQIDSTPRGEDTQNIEYLIISFALYEPQLNYDYSDWVDNTINYIYDNNMFPALKTITILYDGVHINFQNLPCWYPIYGHQMKFFLLQSDPEIVEAHQIGVDYSINWNPICNDGEKRALWLIGDISNRPHKFPLLYKFARNFKLGKLTYSLTNALNGYDPLTYDNDKREDSGLVDMFKNHFDMDITFDELVELYKGLECTLPGDETFHKMIPDRLSFSLATYVYPTEWNDSSLIIMPETWFEHPGDRGSNQKHFWEHGSYPTTEKTWKPIVTKRPFIGISELDLQERTLENLGYKTFRKYTTKPELISDSHMRKCEYVDIAYERVLSFLDNCDEHYHDIVSDLEFNYRHHKHVINKSWNLLYQACPFLKGVDKIKFLRLFVTPPPLRQYYDSPDSDWIYQ